MFKKTWVLSVAVALIVLGLCTMPCLAQNLNVTSTSKKGSLLIFPKILVEGADVDTIITIGNDYSDAVKVKCYWMNKDQVSWDFVFSLTAYQSVWFKASTGDGTKPISEFGSGEGELKCWAIKEIFDKNTGQTVENQISWNHLYGTAMIFGTSPPESAEYSPFTFAARNVALGSAVITSPDTGPGNLVLSGSQSDPGYDACPSYLIFNFFAKGSTGTALGTVGESDLALAPCKQDFRQDAGPICAKVKFDVWNQNENKYTGAYQCVKCWFEGTLSEMGTEPWEHCDLGKKCKPTGVGGQKFTIGTLKTDMGRFRVTPDTFSACNNVFAYFDQSGNSVVDVCSGYSYKIPFVGVLLTETLPAVTSPHDVLIGETPTSAGIWTSTTPVVSIQWDPGLGTDSSAKR